MNLPGLAAPPTADELVGPPEDRYHDGPCVLEHFLGKTQADAFAFFAGRMHYLREDFVWMKPRGQIYYLPPLIEHLRQNGATDPDVYDAISSLAIIATSESQPPSSEVIQLIKQFAATMRQQLNDVSDWQCYLEAIDRS